MKKLALAVALLGVFGSAQAAHLSVANQSALINPFGNYDGEPLTVTGAETAGVTGNLFANVAGSITFTYLGQESGNKNRFILELGNSTNLKFVDNNGNAGTTPLGTGITDASVGPGLVDFRFRDTSQSSNNIVQNGFNPNGSNGLKFAFLGNLDGNNVFQFDHVSQFGPFDYILGFNDFGNDDDYDDLVVGVNFTPNAVPVPAALPLMASALALFGFGASRRRI